MPEVACRSAALSAVPLYSVASAETTNCEVNAHSKTATFSSDLTPDPVSHGLIQPAAVCNSKVALGTKSVNLSGIRNTHIPAEGRGEGASRGAWSYRAAIVPPSQLNLFAAASGCCAPG